MTVQIIIHNDLKLFPYKVQIIEKQTDANKQERSEFCHSISERIENNPDDLGLILFSDEAHFHLTYPTAIKSGESYSMVCYRQKRDLWAVHF